MKSCLLALLIPFWLFTGAATANPPDTMHTIFLEQEDAVGAAHATKTRFEGYHAGTAADPYLIDADFEQMAGSSGGFIVFREQDPENFYQIDLNATTTKIQNKVGGIYSVVASVAHGYGTVGRDYKIRLVMADNHFAVYDRALSLTTPILQWTDPGNSHPVGRNVSYYAKPGGEVCWTRVSAHPQSLSPLLNAWDLPGVGTMEGYLAGQDKSGDPSIGSARYDLSFDNYRADIFGYGPWNTFEVGQMGSMEYAFKTTVGNAGLTYRASSPTSGHLPRSGYQVRQLPDGRVAWGLVDSSGRFQQKATSVDAYPFGTLIRVTVQGNSHLVTLDDGTVVIPTQVDGTYDGSGSHVRCMFGFDASGAGGVIGGWVRPL